MQRHNAAKRMHQTAIANGFRNSGISISATDRMIVAVRSTLKMDIPCIVDGILIVKREQVEFGLRWPMIRCERIGQ